MASPVHTLILGHSFVHRAESFTKNNSMPNLKLPSQFHSVKFLGRGGAHISDIPLLFETRGATPDLVILDIGTNDLASLTPTQTLAVNVFKAAKSMLKSGVKRIVILETLYRSPVGKNGAPPLFNTRVRQFNSQLKYLIKNHTHMEYWYHKGLASRITIYLSDGVHLNVELTRKYVRSSGKLYGSTHGTSNSKTTTPSSQLIQV